jgi:hypothetical protein
LPSFKKTALLKQRRLISCSVPQLGSSARA